MNKMRYSKKKYIQKISDCNQVRNLMFYRKSGYKFFSQKRDPSLSQDIMENIFEEVFLNNLSLSEKEIDLSNYLGSSIRIRFIAMIGTGFKSDIAIDNIRIEYSSSGPPDGESEPLPF